MYENCTLTVTFDASAVASERARGDTMVRSGVAAASGGIDTDADGKTYEPNRRTAVEVLANEGVYGRPTPVHVMLMDVREGTPCPRT